MIRVSLYYKHKILYKSFKIKVIADIYLSAILCLLFTLLINNYLFAQDSNCRTRLPEVINRYPSVAAPVVSPDGKYLYFSRKWYPGNLGGVQDEDDIWFSEHLDNGLWTEPKNLGLQWNTKTSNVIFSITPDNKRVLYYKNNQNDSNSNPFQILSCYENKLSFKENIIIDDFYNNSGYYFANLSAEGNILILALDRNNGKSDLDLYVSFRKNNSNEWTAPKSLGNVVNSKKRETSPYLAYDDKTLYFSSNGRSSKGKYDLYMTRRLDDSWQMWTEPIKLDSNINTKFDETAIYLTPLGDSCYIVSSDTTTELPGIYNACLSEKYRPEPYVILYGKIIIPKSSIFLNDSIVDIKISNNNKIITKEINLEDEANDCLIILPTGLDYNLEASYPNKAKFIKNIDTRNIKKSQYLNQNIIFEDVRLDSNFHYTVYFEFDNSEITNKSETELNNICNNIKSLKNIRVELIGYTDSVGTEEYNIKLSKDRAVKVFNYLISNGINKKSINIKAQGSHNLISKDDALNRRVEIIINGEKK
jgi:OmpA-OmpF porin, OOP family